MSTLSGVALTLLVVALAAVPLVASGYQLALAISVMSYTVLATAWALFSGPTRYVSLATAAFFGIGAYSVAVLTDHLPWPLVLVVAALLGAAVALVVGLCTLRLSGIYFVIFTFGLAELIRQLVTWYEVNVNKSVGRYIFTDITQGEIYWQLLALAVLVFLAGFLVLRSRLGLALRVIGEDEQVARHLGIDTTRAKLTLFTMSAAFMSLTGAVMAPRWTYVDPNISFNAIISFQVLIMALFGGAGRLWGPVVGTVPLVLLFDLLTASFPNYFSILLGVIFLLIVYALPDGVAGLLSGGLARWRTRRPRERVEHVPQKSPPVWRARTCSEKGIERDDNAKKSHPGLAAGLRNFWPAAKPARALAAFGANGGPILAIDGLRKSFGGLVAVDHLDLFVRKGEILGLIGPNGSGKTTALNLISGALRSDAGEIRLHGQPIERLSPARIARLGVARTFQLVRVLGSMTCLDNVVTGTAFRSSPLWGEAARQTAMSLLARVGLADKAPVPASQLTYIDQKRLELARALALGPDLLLLDEWLAGLNPSELKDGIALIQSLRDEGLSILIVEHVMDAIRALCDRCVVMSAGRKIAEGAPAAVLSDREVVRAYLGEADA